MASSGNFATLNPLVKYSTGTFSNGNLTYASGSDDGYTSTIGLNFKSYCEVRVDAINVNGGTIGFRGATDEDEYFDVVSFQENYQSGKVYHYKGSTNTAVSIANIGGTVSVGNIIMMAYDPATYKWWVGVNGTWRNSGDPANGTGFVFQGSATMFENMGSIHWGAWNGTYTHTITFNFGQDSTFGGQETAGGNADDNGFGDFKYSVPTGFLANCSGNIAISDDIDPAQTDDDYPGKQFNVVTYTGNGSNSARTINGFNFSPDLIWVKSRSDSSNHMLVDSSRGGDKYMYSNANNAELTSSNMITFGDSDGYVMRDDGTYLNGSSRTYVAWGWRANGGTTATNAEGATNSTVQANTKSGFSIINYTGTGSTTTIGHGLDTAPDFMIHKNRDTTDNWVVYARSQGASKRAQLNSNITWGTSTGSFNSTDPSSTLITLGSSSGTNASSGNYVCYAWHNVEGYQRFGTYIGNNTDNDGPFVYTGFRPRMLAIKGATESYPWCVFDSARNTHNLVDKHIAWNYADAEATEPTGARKVDFLSNGFKVMADAASINGDADTYVYMAWGDVPFKYNNTF